MPHRYIVRQVGLRGEAMVLLGCIWIWIGVGVLIGASQPPLDANLWHVAIPRPARAALWIATGVLSLLGARWHHVASIALGLLMVMPMIRITSYLWAWIVYLIPGPPPGVGTGWYSAAFYALMIGVVVMAAHIPPRLTGLSTAGGKS